MRPERVAVRGRAAMREATAAHHDRVDALFSAADLGHRETYGRFLLAQAEAQLAAEDALDRADAGSVVPDWAARRRAPLLLADLSALGLARPPGVGTLALPGPAAVLGAVYVLEGSRLGGQLLRRAVPPHLPANFLDAANPAGWRRLLALLDERLAAPAALAAAVTAAGAVFELFERSGRRHLVPPPP